MYIVVAELVGTSTKSGTGQLADGVRTLRT